MKTGEGNILLRLVLFELCDAIYICKYLNKNKFLKQYENINDTCHTINSTTAKGYCFYIVIPICRLHSYEMFISLTKTS